jgi:hypothetical protein
MIVYPSVPLISLNKLIVLIGIIAYGNREQ